MRVCATTHCQWHKHWLRVVEYGVLGRSQEEEFTEWWDQFQPYGRYGDNPGIWWANVTVLWPALTGLGEVPAATELISRELLVRRAEVRKFLAGEAWWHDPWARVSGLPLPEWTPEVWQPRATAWAMIRQQELAARETKGAA